ncbi:MAG: hypothetical protein U9P42_03100 [Candidatus Fermentibacteria bacterium]|nr:hypothetical protein [Candidatus Fermentibacteria bacterium]
MLGVLFTAVLAIVSSGGFAAFVSSGGEAVSVLDTGGETVFTVEALPGERLSNPEPGHMKIVFVSSAQGLVQADMLTGELTILSDEHTGAPWISSSGDLWYTLNGYLLMNGVSTGVQIPAFHVSVEDGLAAFTDRGDDLHILSLESGEDTVVSGYRFYAPFVLPGGDVLASSLTGEIVYVPSGQNSYVVANGSQPCWSTELSGLFYCKSEDDGHSITAADIWFVRPGEEAVQVTFTPEVLETRPACSCDVLWFMDENLGIPECVSLNDVSF